MFWERFYSLCQEIGKKPNPVGKEIGVSSGAITKWKNGTIPPADTLLSIAEYFHVSLDYLLGNTDEKNRPQNEDGVITDPLEARLMESVRQLSDDQKKLLLAQLDILLADKEK